MKKIVSLLWIPFLMGFLVSCQELTPLTPPNPVVGKWTLLGWQVFHLPAWYAAKTHDDYFITTANDTVYGGPPPQRFDVTSLTFTAGGRFSEFYLLNPGLVELTTPQIDSGRWSLADSVVSLTVANTNPHKLTYRAATDQLVTDIYPKTAVIRLSDESINTVSYSIRIYYRRAP